VRVEFRKTGTRRYGVFVERENAPAMWADPAPGYDDFLPHDLLHFVAEAAWGLDGAVFGQLASGGDPGVFIPADPALVAKAMRRRKLRRKRHGHRKGRRSELLAGILEDAWYVRKHRRRLPDGWEERLASARVAKEKLETVVTSLDELAERWHSLRIGDSLTLEWPRPRTARQRRT